MRSKLRRWITILAMGALLSASMGQVIPSSCPTAMAAMDQSQGGHDTPCQDAAHACHDALGCVSLVSFAMAEVPEALHTVIWTTAADYRMSEQVLEGRSIAPDLPVPILFG